MPYLDHRSHIWKKGGISNSFQTNFTTILPVVHIFSLTIMTYLKKLIGIKSPNTKQCRARLSFPPVKLSSFIRGKCFLQKRI